MTTWEIHYDPEGSWAAVYHHGVLVDGPGDSYNREEYLFGQLGVKTVHDDAFLLGGGGRDGHARTVAEIEAYQAEREERTAKAADLRQQAEELLKQANEITGEATR